MSDNTKKILTGMALENIGRLTLILLVAALSASVTVAVETIVHNGDEEPTSSLQVLQRQNERLEEIHQDIKGLEKQVEKQGHDITHLSKRIDNVLLNSR